LLYPITPETSLKVLKIFDMNENDIKLDSIKNHELNKKNSKINKIGILFKKIDKND
jgi:Methionyl-tRNA synthetase